VTLLAKILLSPLCVVAVFTQAHGGFAPLAVLLHNFLIGFYGFAAFCFVLAITVHSISTAAAFGLATAAALAVQGTIFLLRSHPLGRSMATALRLP
jgi:hypothetical protein